MLFKQSKSKYNNLKNILIIQKYKDYGFQFRFSSGISNALMKPFENPTKSLLPNVFQAIEVTWWNFSNFTFLLCFPSRFFFPSNLYCPLTIIGFFSASKSQICHPFSVPMAIHGLLGLNAKALTGDPASCQRNGFQKSLKQKIITFLSFPPVTMYFPLGENMIAFTLPSCGLKEPLIQKGKLFQIFKYPSHPTEVKKCPPSEFFEVGRNLILETQSLWFQLLTVCLQSPLTFQSLICLSAPDERMYFPSDEMAHDKTSFVCPSSVNLWAVFPVLRSQSLMVLSHEDESRQLLSLVNAKSEIKWECPVRL